jgi:hypothetical protein
MKPTLFALLFILTTAISLSANAQRAYTPITSSFSSTAYPSGTICNSCELVLSPGVTITINSTCACTNCTFVGGTIIIASGSNFTLSGVDSFVNENVQMNNSFPVPSSGVTFYGDTVAFNTAMSLTGGRTILDSSRVSVNAALTLDEGTFYKDSLHLNKNLTLNYSTDTISTSNIDVANGVTITAAVTNVINSTFGFAGNSKMNFDYGMTSAGSNYYLGGTSTINVPNAATLSSDNVVTTGTNNYFTVGNGLTTTNTNFNLAGTNSKLTVQSMTMTGGSIKSATGSTISSTNGISLTNTATTLTGTTFGGSQLTTSGGSFTATNSPVNSTYAISLTNTPTSISGGSFSGSQLTTSGGSFTASNTTVSSTYAVSFTNTPASFTNSTFTGSALTTSGSTFTLNNTNTTITYSASLSGTQANLIGNSSLTAQSMSLASSTWFAIGDGTLGTSTTSAHVNLTYSASEDGTSTLAIANNNNYLQSSATGAVSCGGAAPQHACATGYIYGCATIKSSAAPVGCTLLALASMNLSADVAGPGRVALTWTDSETGSAADHYTIQRNNGNNEWTDLGTITAGNTTGDYYFTDANAPAGTVDYRIQRTDADGNILYSAVASVTLAVAGSPLSIYPNPAIGGRFYINTPYTGEMVVNVYTSTGQLLLHTSLQNQTQYAIQLPLQSLSLSAVVVQTISQNGNGAFTVLVR